MASRLAALGAPTASLAARAHLVREGWESTALLQVVRRRRSGADVPTRSLRMPPTTTSRP